MTKLDWDRARKRQAGRRRKMQGKRLDRSVILREFVVKHDLACFKCGTKAARWAKTGTNARGPWAICSECVEAPTKS